MRARLLALAALVSALGAGVVIWAQWGDSTIDATPELPGGWEMIDRGSCTTAPCGALKCLQAQDVLTDAGRGDCDTRLVECDVRMGARARAMALDAGDAPAAEKYQRVRFVALRCPGVDGGRAFGIPVDDAGYPVWGTVAVTPRCVRAPVGVQTCQRDEGDGGSRWFGDLNVFPAALAKGSGCQPVSCTVMFGDQPETDL